MQIDSILTVGQAVKKFQMVSSSFAQLIQECFDGERSACTNKGRYSEDSGDTLSVGQPNRQMDQQTRRLVKSIVLPKVIFGQEICFIYNDII